jgi:hypothetical protein
MDALLRMALVIAISFAPAAFVLLMTIRERRARLSSNAAPFQELRRRPAGEALRIRIAEIDERIFQSITYIAAIPALVATTAWFVRTSPWLTLAPQVFLCVICTSVLAFKLKRTVRERENYRLGYDGERFVGEELSRLIAYGFEIYHDVPFDDFNIDHVLVGPSGVYCVETKTRRKPVNDSGGKEYHVAFDGKCLRWPWGNDTSELDQAANNARTLSQWLGSAVGDSVYVTPILALPGWMVDRSVPRSTVQVLNPKQIVKVVSNANENKLSESFIKRICHQLDQKCRIEVE